jgi:hypothetical protein
LRIGFSYLSDVGCGSSSMGCVNCDLFICDVLNHRGSASNGLCTFKLDFYGICNFVLCVFLKNHVIGVSFCFDFWSMLYSFLHDFPSAVVRSLFFWL